MAEVPHDLQRQLESLTALFHQRLQKELPELDQKARALTRARDLQQQHRQLQSLRDQLHRLAGSAGSFGLGQLGQQARILEQQAEHWLGQLELENRAIEAFAHSVQRLAQQEFQVEAPQAMPVSEAPPQESHSLQRIFILEEEPLIGESMQLTLRSFGYAVECFASPEALDQALERSQPDALILDLNLQGGGGLEYAARLQQRITPLPLLVISRDDDFATRLAAVRSGAIGFFTRPVDITLLENRLERCFAQQQGEPYRVLIVDDDNELATRFALILRNARMIVDVLQKPADILARMRHFNPEVVLLDVHMPECSGTELAQIIRFHDEWLRVPIVYLSAETDLARQMGALLRAGDDFVTKPISDSALVTTVFSRAQRARLLSNALARDSLTGLLKHADIKEQIALEVERATRNGKPASVVMLDIDHFKQINDRYGHAAGDNVLRALANLLRQRLRRIDSLGRYGGEEFAAVLPDCPAVQAQRILEEIRQRFAELRFIAGHHEFAVTLSAGIAQTDRQSSAATLLEQADKALYRAKHEGRNLTRCSPID